MNKIAAAEVTHFGGAAFKSTYLYALRLHVCIIVGRCNYTPGPLFFYSVTQLDACLCTALNSQHHLGQYSLIQMLSLRTAVLRYLCNMKPN